MSSQEFDTTTPDKTPAVVWEQFSGDPWQDFTPDDAPMLGYLIEGKPLENPAAKERYNPDKFYTLLSALALIGDDRIATTTLNRFVGVASIEYAEVDESLIEHTNLLDSIEVEISRFIESGEQFHRLAIIGPREARSLGQIYNRQNLLAFAQSTASRHPDGLVGDLLDAVFRYRTVVRRVEEELDKEPAQDRLHYGTQARAWAGEVREYGYDNAGRIHGADYREFSGGDLEEEERPTVVAEDLVLRLNLKRHFDE